jgi:hypothetical protein
MPDRTSVDALKNMLDEIELLLSPRGAAARESDAALVWRYCQRPSLADDLRRTAIGSDTIY